MVFLGRSKKLTYENIVLEMAFFREKNFDENLEVIFCHSLSVGWIPWEE